MLFDFNGFPLPPPLPDDLRRLVRPSHQPARAT